VLTPVEKLTAIMARIKSLKSKTEKMTEKMSKLLKKVAGDSSEDVSLAEINDQVLMDLG